MYSGKETKVKSRMGKQMAVKKWHLRGTEARRTARADQRVFSLLWTWRHSAVAPETGNR